MSLRVFLFSLILSLFISLFVGGKVFAETTVVSVSNASAYDISTPKSIKVYGGYIINASVTCVAGGTCDTCDGTCSGGDRVCPCNHQGIVPTSDLSITMTTSIDMTGRVVLIKKVSDSTTLTNTGTSSGSTLVAKATWDAWADGASTSWDTTANGYQVQYYIGPSKTSDTTSFEDAEKVTVTLLVESVDQDSNELHTECPSGSGTDYQGFCYYTFFPGDEKLYIDTAEYSSNYPTATSGGGGEIKFNKMIFFYAEGGEGIAGTSLLSSIKTSSPSFEISVDYADGAIYDNAITGLSNRTQYCMVLANQSNTGNISFFQDPAAVGIESRICAIPLPVEGLLDDKKCFIATAAYGSNMDEKVDILRQFRAKFLAPFDWGQKFIKTYYKNSPKWAQKIRHHDNLRAAVRMALWPIVGFAGLSLKIGLGPALALILGFFFLLGGGIFWRRRSKGH